MSTPETKNDENDLQRRFIESCVLFSSLKKTDQHNIKLNKLKNLRNVISSDGDQFILNNDSTTHFENVIKSLINVFNDDSEKCREIAVTILQDIFKRVCIIEDTLPLFFSSLAHCLGKTDERERSEEVRLLELELLHYVIKSYDGNFLSYLNDISTILCSCIVDDCPEVKRKSCECICLLSSKNESHFHMIAENFLKPLLFTISHQHLKTRALCIKALGSIVDFLKNEEIEQVFSHLAQRLFDRSPVVRMAVAEMVGNMLVTLRDRYSYFHKLIPLILSSGSDEVQDIQHKAYKLWENAGSQYLQENEKDYKDLIDFPMSDPINYPDTEKRPHLGCRILVQRNVFNILPALLHDIKDWTPETRVKSTKVLHSLILHSENKITIQLPSALDAVIFAAKDEKKEVVDYGIKTAELLGYFIDPSLLCDSILSLAHPDVSSVHLSVLAATIRGHKTVLPDECFKALSKFLADPLVAQLRKGEEQANLLLCVEGLLTSGNTITDDISYELFTILASTSGLTTNDAISKRADELLEQLAILQTCRKEFLIKQHCMKLLNTLSENNELWTLQSPEFPIFIFIIQSDYLNEDMIEAVIPILKNNLHPCKDAKLRSKILSILISVFKKLSSSQYQLMSEKILGLVQSGIFPNLTWSAGKIASSLRTVAVASLYEIMSRSCVKKEMVSSLGDELLPILVALTEDDASHTRLLSCKILEIILPDLRNSVDEHKIHSACFEILHCMDDETDDIRMVAVKVLRAYIKSFPADYNWKLYRAHLKHIYENVLIHMDDNNEKIRNSVFEFLKEVSFAGPDILLEEIDSKKYMMSDSDLCDSLTQHIKSIKL